MPHSFGYRGRTRQMFARGFRKAGVTPLSTYLINYKVSAKQMLHLRNVRVSLPL
jgi:ribosomal protein L21E